MKNLFSLENRVVIITGASGLLGRQHAQAVASAGGIPILLDLDQKVLDTQAEEIRREFQVGSRGFAVDITSEKAIEKNCSQLLEIYGKIDGLVNNAANNPKVESADGKNFSRLENFSLDVWNADIAVGLTGAFLCCKYYGYAISKNPEGGVIVNIASDLALIAPDQRLYRIHGLSDEEQPVKPVTYSAVKSGLIGLTRYVATYWADKNVRCNAICPGGVENNQNADFLQEIATRIPLGRMARPDEYQAILVFLLGDGASYLNGAVLPADGGRSVW